MNPQYLPIIAAAVVVFVTIVFMGIILSRYTKVGPNQVLIISGRQIHLPDGRVIGYRIVKGGGTFVFPVIEKVDVLSLEILNIILPRLRLPTADGHAVQVDCAAQVKIDGSDASIVAAAEHFLSKSQAQMNASIQPVLEKHLNSVSSSSNCGEIVQNPAAFAAKVQAATAEDLGKMGLEIISLTIRNARTA